MEIRKKKFFNTQQIQQQVLHNSNKIYIPSVKIGKVRQTLAERRQKAGVDRSYPLLPLNSKTSTKHNILENIDTVDHFISTKYFEGKLSNKQANQKNTTNELKPVSTKVKELQITTSTTPQFESFSNIPNFACTTMSKPTTRSPSSGRPSAKQSARSAVVRDDLAECNFCGRRFATDRIQKHEEICSKTGKKKRKAYDAAKHRVMGTELESYVIKGGKKSTMSGKSTNKSSMKKDWRKTHEEFIAAIRAAKEAQAHLAKGGKLADLPPPPPSSNPDYIQCPHCGRRFNEAAAERHIPKCASYQYNKPKPGSDTSKAKATKK